MTERLLSVIVLILLFVPILIIALIIQIDDPHGSPFYAQKRIGKDGRAFRMFKLRTMREGAEKELDELLMDNEMSGPPFKIKDDPRITRVGRFLRETGLDELPQFLNVIVGDMSVVGPRPPLPREVKCYNEYQMQRLSVTPGITCYWQIHPDRNEMSFDDWVELDLRYIRERSLRTDIGIMVHTIDAMLRRQGQ